MFSKFFCWQLWGFNFIESESIVCLAGTLAPTHFVIPLLFNPAISEFNSQAHNVNITNEAEIEFCLDSITTWNFNQHEF
jgi:hypothetical protein